ncbi:hypothetical protein SBVcX29_0065 [Vibrio phage X29]|uniref:hypothetical protein n=1 Tax=Vibrio phage X29 TaxID=1500713 RepID=UPI00045FC15C|nr:hypothetical protein SBVcX29_0065 [Vibrio phage X29]AIA10344.1 hypothetical protein SBVcX29_0065 [Vibrio phage X29]
MTERYFIQDVIYNGNDSSYTAKTVAMGDGFTGVNTLIWDDSVGVLFHRSDFVKPFERVEYTQENQPKEFQGELVAITFDNVMSIDAVIRQLTECRENLLRIQNETNN